MTGYYLNHRVEPISREGDPGRGLAAPVHDPLWLLARQYQFGELDGEDTGSPVQVDFRLASQPLDGWASAEGDMNPYDPRRDVLDSLVSGESAGSGPSLRDRVTAGRHLVAILPTEREVLLTEFPVSAPPNASRIALRLASSYPDGVAAALAVRGATDAGLAAALGMPEPAAATAREALRAYERWATATFGLTDDTWVPERLERRFRLSVGGVTALTAPAQTRGEIAAVDLELTTDSAALLIPTPADELHARMPQPVRFPGMPRDRFWEFEDAQLALHRIDAATHDLARLALVEFTTLYGNDWFTFPLPVRFGSVAAMSELVVRDTFGTAELVSLADDAAWSMFAPSRPDGVPPRLVVPAITTGVLTGPVTEEVALLRDENANLVWGLEKIVTDDAGDIHDVVGEYVSRQEPRPFLPSDALHYQLMTDVPEHWVPFIPVHVDAGKRQVGLLQAALPRPGSGGDAVVAEPRSRLLAELRGVVLREEEVPSEGVTVRRQWHLARTADGGRHVWMARSVLPGRGEGNSGLAFDITLDDRGV